MTGQSFTGKDNVKRFFGSNLAEPYPVTDSTPPRVRDTTLIIVAQCNTRNLLDDLLGDIWAEIVAKEQFPFAIALGGIH
jgi:hypothetical protein